MDNLTNDLSSQKEEIKVLAAIFGDEWFVDNEEERLFHIRIEDHGVQLILELQFPPNYPSESPPDFTVMPTSSSFCQTDVEEITKELHHIYLKRLGMPVVHEWVEKIREWVQKKAEEKSISILPVEEQFAEESKLCGAPTPSPGDCIPDEEENLVCARLQENVCIIKDLRPVDTQANTISSLKIIHGNPITVKKSTFQGHVTIISDPKDANVFVSELMKNKKIASATRNIQAYRIFKEKSNTYDEHYDDDKEKQAGHRLLHLMQIMNVRNVMVVVSRWHGGIKIGPDRFRLINDAATEVLKKGNFIPPPEGKKKK